MSRLQAKNQQLTSFIIRCVCCCLALLMVQTAQAAVSVYDIPSRTPETDVFAYDGESGTQTPGNNTTPASALSNPSDYNDIATIDGTFHSYLSTTKNNYLQMRFVFQIDEAVGDVTQLDVSWTGKGASTAPGSSKDGANLYIWNDTSGSYELLDSYNTDDSVITLTGTASGASADYLTGAGNDTVTILVTSSQKVFNGRQYELFSDHVSLSVTSGASVAAPFGFNCIASGADPVSGTLYTRLVNTAFSFDVAALQDSDSNGVADGVETAYAASGDVTVLLELIDTSTVASCADYPALSPAVSQNVTFTASDNGVVSASQTVTKAYRSVGCRVTDSVNAIQGCSTDSFAIRPTDFSITSNMTNLATTGSPVAKAGDAFTLTATALAGYDGTPAINNALVEAHAGAIQNGNVGGSFNAAAIATGIATGNAFTYSEVGHFRFQSQGVYDSTFTAVDQPNDCTDDFSNTLVGDKVGCLFGNESNSDYFGRFTPDHFVVTVANAGSLQASCNGFAYSGESFGYVAGDVPTLSITAENGLGSPTATQNYTGIYSKLSTGSFAMALTADASNLGDDGLTLLAINWVPGASLADNGDGTFTFDLAGDAITYIKEANAEVAPVTSDMDLVVTEVRDSDNILANAMPVTMQPTGIGIRFGRLALNNAYGSELIDLPVPLKAEYFAGSSVGYVTNSLDNCTSLAVSDLTLSSAVESGQTDGDIQVLVGAISQASLGNVPLLGGQAGLVFCPPGSPACSASSGNTGSIDIQVSAPTHLQFDWDSDGAYDNEPTGRASFGLYPGHLKQIYLREVY